MKRFLSLLALTVFSSCLYYCKSTKQPNEVQQSTSNVSASATQTPDFSKSPFLSAQEALTKFEIEDGFEIQLVASEPLINTPVFISFDQKGRIWTVEMIGYMPDTVGTGEDQPSGRIVLLEDKNKDGVMDSRKVVIDSLVLPRAICAIEGGLLVAEPPALWYYEFKDDKPVKRSLVDDQYAVGGNVEHQPNGLLRGLDNWIYNAKSDKRYRKVGNQWLIEKTHFRGQWGISHDNDGRLYYNHNSQNVLSDFFTPGVSSLNSNLRNQAGFNEKSVVNNRVYPARPTTGVNRGYMDGILDSNNKLVNFTAACGPLVYRGDLFPSAYDENIFVPEPAANLVKRNVMTRQGNLVIGEQAYAEREFIRSTDERFRPVSLHNAPDGAMYMVDMYRGIIQHKTYLTPYLKGEIAKRDLTLPLASGRIYRIVPKGSKYKSLAVDQATDLVTQLGHKNGWIRDFTQQTIIDQKLTGLIPRLKEVVRSSNNTLQVTHAIWTLEGLQALSVNEVKAIVSSNNWALRTQGLSALFAIMNEDNADEIASLALDLLQKNEATNAPYLAFLSHKLEKFNREKATQIRQQLGKSYANDVYTVDALLSGLEEEEADYLSAQSSLDTASILYKRTNAAIKNSISKKKGKNAEDLAKLYPKGAELFISTCQTCHGKDGNGVKSLGPPLNKSEWVTGNKQQLIAIVLFGLTGPITVNGHVYQAPEIFGDMPAIGYDESLKDEDIAELLSYIRNNWENTASSIRLEEIRAVRQQFKGRQNAFTQAELENLR